LGTSTGKAVASASLPAARAATPSARTRLTGLRFTGALLAACLFLQRFGLPVDGASISLVGPVGLALAAYGLAQGTLALHRKRLAIFLTLLALAVLGAAWQAVHPNSFGIPPIWPSLAQFLVLTSFATLSFTEPVGEAAFFGVVTRLLAIIAAAGIVQFVLQFAGIRIFAFTGLLPERLLYEAGWNLEIPVGIGAVMKSNGFFLVEPSVFSQVMAVGLIIEVLMARRALFLAAFAAGLLLSFSGTGWIILAGFGLTAFAGLGRRGAVMGLAAALIVVFAFGAMMLVAPDFAAAFSDRLAEFQTPGTSAHLRFITPFWLLGDVVAREPSSLLVGIGAGASERLTLPYVFDVNTPVKIVLEYGVPALMAYVALFVTAARTRNQAALLVPVLLWFFVTGGYQQFPPVLFFALLLLAVARLRPDTANPAADVALG
jgi:hypothetical protein